MDEKSLPKPIAASAYPPDGVPFEQIERLADAFAVMLGTADLAPMSAPHLAAWAVAVGALTKRQAAAAVAEARQAGNCPMQRLVELGRLLRPYFVEVGNLAVIAVRLRTGVPVPPSIDEPTAELAAQLTDALGGELGWEGDMQGLSSAAVLAAKHVRADRLEMADVWAMVADARRTNIEAPGQAFHSLVYWIERLRLLSEARPALADAYAAAIERAPKCPAPSAN